MVELNEILSAIRTLNDNADLIKGQRGRKREVGSPPIAIKTATDELLVLQLNAPRIVGGVLRCFVHQPKQRSNEPAKGKEETAAHYVLVGCMIIIKCNGILSGSTPLRFPFEKWAIQHLVQNFVTTQCLLVPVTSINNNVVFPHQGIDCVVKVGSPYLDISRVGPFMFWPSGNSVAPVFIWPNIAIRLTELKYECPMQGSVPGSPVQ